VVACATVGCGAFSFVEGPPRNHRDLANFSCTSSRTIPIVNTALVALQIVNLGFLLRSSDQKWEDSFGGTAPVGRVTGAGVAGALAAVGAASASYGFVKTAQCRAARRELQERLADPARGYGSWPPPSK
jgi:hypothetical protein